MLPAQGVGDLSNLALAGEKNENVPLISARDLFDRVGNVSLVVFIGFIGIG